MRDEWMDDANIRSYGQMYHGLKKTFPKIIIGRADPDENFLEIPV